MEIEPADWIAGYAAIVATVVGVWQIYKEATEGARLRVTVQAGMKTFGGSPKDANTYVAVNVTNVGTGPTSITHLVLTTYPSWWAFWWRKPDATSLVPNPTPMQIPEHLEPGKFSIGLIIENDDLYRLAEGKLVAVTVTHTMSNRSVRQLVRQTGSKPGRLRASGQAKIIR